MEENKYLSTEDTELNRGSTLFNSVSSVLKINRFRLHSLFLFLLISLLITFTNCYAAELRVIDEVGLIRAVRVVKDKGKILLEVVHSGFASDAAQKAFPESIILSNSDSLAADMRAIHNGNGHYSAVAVPSGTWKIILADKSFEVQDVRIVEKP